MFLTVSNAHGSPSLCVTHSYHLAFIWKPGLMVKTGIPDMEPQQRWGLVWLQRAEKKKWPLSINVHTLKRHSIPTPTLLRVHLLLILLWKNKLFTLQVGPFDPHENPVFVPLIWGSVVAQSTMAALFGNFNLKHTHNWQFLKNLFGKNPKCVGFYPRSGWNLKGVIFKNCTPIKSIPQTNRN